MTKKYTTIIMVGSKIHTAIVACIIQTLLNHTIMTISTFIAFWYWHHPSPHVLVHNGHRLDIDFILRKVLPVINVIP